MAKQYIPSRNDVVGGVLNLTLKCTKLAILRCNIASPSKVVTSYGWYPGSRIILLTAPSHTGFIHSLSKGSHLLWRWSFTAEILTHFLYDRSNLKDRTSVTDHAVFIPGYSGGTAVACPN